jgi:hypothetical protein
MKGTWTFTKAVLAHFLAYAANRRKQRDHAHVDDDELGDANGKFPRNKMREIQTTGSVKTAYQTTMRRDAGSATEATRTLVSSQRISGLRQPSEHCNCRSRKIPLDARLVATAVVSSAMLARELPTSSSLLNAPPSWQIKIITSTSPDKTAAARSPGPTALPRTRQSSSTFEANSTASRGTTAAHVTYSAPVIGRYDALVRAWCIEPRQRPSRLALASATNHCPQGPHGAGRATEQRSSSAAPLVLYYSLRSRSCRLQPL